MRRFLLAATTAAALPLFWATAANAALISIGLQETGVNGGAITTVATDASTPGTAGVINMSYGSFSVNNISALGYPDLTSPNFDTNSINLSDTSGGTITVLITEQGLSTPTGVNNFLSGLTSNLFNGSVTSIVETTFVSTSNALYGGTQLATYTFSGLGTSNQVDATPSLPSSFSETTEYVITTTGSADVNDTIDISSVPEPASLAILGASLLAMPLIRRRKSS